MLERLVDRFWRWELRRHDPEATVRCPVCRTAKPRRDGVKNDRGWFCSEACSAEEYRNDQW